MAVTNNYHTTASWTPSLSAVAAGAALDDGWIDVDGLLWTTNGSNQLVAGTAGGWNNKLLARPTGENQLDQRMVVTFPATTSSDTPAIVLRRQSNLSCYIFIHNPAGYVVSWYEYTPGGGYRLVHNFSPSAGYAAGHDYQLDVSVEGASTLATVTLKDLTAATTTLNAVTFTDPAPAAAVQAAGRYALSSGHAGDKFGAVALYDNVAVDTTPPVFASASVPANGRSVAVVLTEAGSPPVLPATGVTGFTVQVNGATRTPSGVTASGTTVTIAFSVPNTIKSGDTVTVAYTPGNVTDSATSPNAMLAFAAQAVTNNSTQTTSTNSWTLDYEANNLACSDGTSFTAEVTGTQGESEAVSAAAAHAGTYGLLTQKTGTTGDNGLFRTTRAVATNSGISSIAFDFRAASLAGVSGGIHFADLYDAGANFVACFDYSGSSGWGIALRHQDNLGGEEHVYGATLVAGTWYRIELVYDVTGAAPVAELLVGGVVVQTLTDPTIGTAPVVTGLKMGGYESAFVATATMHYDNLSFANAVQTLAAAAAAAAGGATRPVAAVLYAQGATMPTNRPTYASYGAQVVVPGVVPLTVTVVTEAQAALVAGEPVVNLVRFSPGARVPGNFRLVAEV